MDNASRQHFIGGSDIGAIVGVSKWKTPLDIWLEKTGQAVAEVDPQREKLFRRGKRMEPVVLDMLAEERGYEIALRSARHIDVEHPFMACEIDAMVVLDGEDTNIEVKTSHPFAAGQWGEEDTDEIDVSYAAQAQWGLGITGRKRCIFAVLIGSDNLVTYEVLRDEDTIAAMRAKALAFWNDNVLANVPPPPVNLPDVLQLFGRKTETRKEATPDIAALVNSLYFMRQRETAAKDAIEELKYQIGSYLLGADPVAGKQKPGLHVLTYNGEPILQIALQEGERVDLDTLRLKFPDAAAACSVPTASFVYRKPRKGSK